MPVKVILEVNGEEAHSAEVESVSIAEIRGSTGVASYRTDPTQDHTIKVVVNGTKMDVDKDDKRKEMPSLNPADYPVPQLQTGDAGNSDSDEAKRGIVDADGNPITEQDKRKSEKDEKKPEPATSGSHK